MQNPSAPLSISETYEKAASCSVPPLGRRLELLGALKVKLQEKKEHLARTISEEVGKPLWDSRNEIDSVIQKIPISIAAFNERCKEMEGRAYRRYKPFGIAVVFGPFNFPMHLPNGHIIPALLAGNKVIFKPSEFTPRSGIEYFKLFEQSGFPEGLVQLVEGGKEVGQQIIDDARLNAFYFTGSAKAGLFFSKFFAGTPGKMIALEMGGNNPLVISNIKDLDAAVYGTLLSAYLTTGQRCTCARRLIVIENEPFIKKLIEKIPTLKIGSFNETPEPFMGPLIHEEAVQNVLHAQKKLGGKILVECKSPKKRFITPGLIDVTGVKTPDEEIFGPLLQMIRVKNLKEAIAVANDTAYGLVSAIFTDRDDEYQTFYQQSKTGLINKNTPTTGALSTNPFGGTGISGNHRPSAYFAADYCSYVLAGIESDCLDVKQVPGLPYG